jgi:hypothetical protein
MVWAAKASEGFRSESHGVVLELDSVATRNGARLYLTMTCGEEKVLVEEPVAMALFGDAYETEVQRDLARLMRELFTSAAGQCAERERSLAAAASTITKQEMFRRILFGQPEEVPAWLERITTSF